MPNLWLLPALISCVGMAATSPPDAQRRFRTLQAPFHPMTLRQKNRFLASKFIKKKAGNHPDVFSTLRLAYKANFDALTLYEAGAVAPTGAYFDSTQLAATFPSATLIYNPTDPSKQHLVVATFATYRAGSFTLTDSKTGQSSSTTVAANASGNLAVVEPAGAVTFNITFAPVTPASAVFVFQQISVEAVE
ncbi:MAG: hypothetical protein ACYC96_09640 [Fimbriimonadaceae bacterium]